MGVNKFALCCCNQFECVDCLEAPYLIQVSITGVVDDTCGSCSDWNDTFELTRSTDASCTWVLSAGKTVCSKAYTMTLTVAKNGSDLDLTLAIAPVITGDTVTFTGSAAAYVDDCCGAPEGETLTLFSSSGTECDWTAATADVVAISCQSACTHCPSQYDITITGVTALASCSVGSCTAINGQTVRVTEDGGYVGGACRYTATWTPTGYCGGITFNVTMFITTQGYGKFVYDVCFVNTVTSLDSYCYRNLTPTVGCDVTSHALSNYAQPSIGLVCDHSGATATVSAV